MSLTYALEISKRWKIFPCKKSKEPLTGEGGYHNATQDEKQIKAWWNKYPNALIGIPCRENGLFVVDVDAYKPGVSQAWGDFVDGRDLCATGPTQQTQRGGMHFFYQDTGFETKGIIITGVESRANNYVCSGNGYTWINDWTLPLPEVPGWLLEAIRKDIPVNGKKNGNGAKPLEIQETIPEGTRNMSLTSIAGKLRKKGLATIELEYALMAINQNRCSPPLDDDEVKTIAASVGRYPAGNYSLSGNGHNGHHQETVTVSPPIDPPIDLSHTHIIKTRWTVAELYATTFPEPNWIIPGLIPPGLTFLAGRPKVGKSWMALQIAHSKATGGKFFGKDVPPGRVVYYAFEDRPSRIKERMTLQGVPMTAAIEFDTERIRLQSGGIERIQRDIEDGISLIVIDTLSRAFGMTDQDDLAEMTVQTGYLQELAQDSNIGLLVIDHHKKPNGFNNDPIDDIIGSTGKAATADAAIGLYRSNGRKEVVLKAVGRDFDDVELSLEWDPTLCCWRCLGGVQ